MSLLDMRLPGCGHSLAAKKSGALWFDLGGMIGSVRCQQIFEDVSAIITFLNHQRIGPAAEA
jgi:hypothetical protein